MKEMIGFYRTELGGSLKHMKGEYDSKKQFKFALMGNGYRVVEVLNTAQVKHIKENNDNATEIEQYINQIL